MNLKSFMLTSKLFGVVGGCSGGGGPCCGGGVCAGGGVCCGGCCCVVVHPATNNSTAISPSPIKIVFFIPLNNSPYYLNLFFNTTVSIL